MNIQEENMRRKGILLTVLTATYNRGYILPKLYESLRSQSSMNFEWLIIDDGSDDNSMSLVEKWMQNDDRFPIRYFYKENGGKHRAINYAVEKINTPYIFLVDSDDQLLEIAIQKVEEWIGTISNNMYFAGVSGLRGYTREKRIGDFPGGSVERKYIDATNVQRRGFRLLGDKAEVYKTEMLVKYSFPENETEKFISESLVWNRIALDGYKIRWFNEIIYLTDYLDDGLTSKLEKLHIDNFIGYTMEVEQDFSFEDWIHKYLILGKYCSIAGKKRVESEWICSHLHITRKQYFIGRLISVLYRIKPRKKARGIEY